jgi:hypothetical protein
MINHRQQLLINLPDLVQQARNGEDIQCGWFLDLYRLYKETYEELEWMLEEKMEEQQV